MLIYLNVTCLTVFFFHKAEMSLQMHTCTKHQTIYGGMVMLLNLTVIVMKHAKHFLQKIMIALIDIAKID